MSDSQISSRQTAYRRRILPQIIPFIALGIFLWGAWSAARAGLSRLLSDYGRMESLLPAADEAVRLSPSDPEAHYARALELSEVGQLAEAIHEFEVSIALRPEDYFLWSRLARARAEAGDEEGALTAATKAVQLAPFYARPRWQRGNLLLRVGRRDEAFVELRRAAASDPSLFLSLIDLAWNAMNGDARLVEQSVQPQTTQGRLALARFFAKHGRAAEAVALFGAAGNNASNEDVRALVTEFVATKNFPEAYAAWAGSHAEAAGNRNAAHAVAVVINEGFESPVSKDDVGFGWQAARDAQFVQASIDASEPHSGTRSLHLEFGGNAAQNSPFVSQLVLVEPHTRYRLSFTARTKEIVTGGLPLVVILDANSSDAQTLLAQSNAMSPGTSDWRNYTVPFVTSNMTNAVRIALKRQTCSGAPCPIFGHLWLDDFSLQKQ